MKANLEGFEQQMISQIRQQKELFQTTIYRFGDIAITTYINGIVQQMNLMAEKLTGWKEKEAENENLDTILK